jgi:2-desacetyl-2-hydroxyethyl bacteriochlorophyllide A dehydrogenase
MHCLWLEKQTLEFRKDEPVVKPGDREALVKVLLAGICSTDLELVRGYYPFTGIPGHEFVGEVVDSPGDSTWVGKRVVGEININCGECQLCQKGMIRHCENRKAVGIHDWNGAFAQYLVMPMRNLHMVPDQVPDEAAVFTEPLAAAYEILEQTSIEPGDRVIVIGAGRLGQLVASVLKLTGCQLQVVVRHQKPRAMLENLGIQTLTPDELDNLKFDIVVEATGSADGLSLACQHVRPRGRIILKSTYKGNVKVNFSKIVVDEVSLIGSRCGPFVPALELLSTGTVDPKVLIEATFPLERGLEAFELAGKPGVFKILLKP